MPRILPLDIMVHIVRQEHAEAGPVYTALTSIGRPDLHLGPRSEVVFWCGATGKSVEACLGALTERALLWAGYAGVTQIEGLLHEGEPCDLSLTVEGDVVLVPVTYNDWLYPTLL